MKKFESEIADVKTRLHEMANVTIQMVDNAARAVKDRSGDLVDKAAAAEKQLDEMQTEIDQTAIRMLTVYGPVASQLRYILVINHVTAQLERIGDQVINVFEALEMMQDQPANGAFVKLNKMADLTCEMVRDALDAYFTEDAAKAVETRAHDDLIDSLNSQILQLLLSDEDLRGVLKGTKDFVDSVAQILVARHLERIADQAVNICKEVVYLVEGKDVRHLDE